MKVSDIVKNLLNEEQEIHVEIPTETADLPHVILACKCLKEYSHTAHLLIKGNTFLQDHAFLQEIYEAAEANFDAVAERCIGLHGDLNIGQLILVGAAKAKELPIGDTASNLGICLGLEKAICAICEEIIRNGNPSPGTEQLLGDICNLSEVRQYKLQRRLS